MEKEFRGKSIKFGRVGRTREWFYKITDWTIVCPMENHKGRVINLSNFCQQIKAAAHTQWTNESACIFYFEIYQPSLLIFNGLPKFLMINNFNSLNQDCLDSSFFSSKSLIFKIKNQWHSNYIRNKICNFY